MNKIYHLNIIGRFWKKTGKRFFFNKTKMFAFIKQKKDESIKYLLDNGVKEKDLDNLLRQDYIITPINISKIKNCEKYFKEQEFTLNRKINKYLKRFLSGKDAKDNTECKAEW